MNARRTLETFRPLEKDRMQALHAALLKNAAGSALHMDQKDTTWREDAVPDEEVIAAISSVPCHYARR